MLEVKIGGREWYLREDGKFWKKSRGLVKGLIPVAKEEIKKVQEDLPKIKPEVEIDQGMMPPEWLVRKAVPTLREVSDTVNDEGVEVWGLFVLNPKDGWFLYLPKQKVTSTEAEFEDLGDEVGMLLRNGNQIYGTIHLHPGRGNTPSGDDKKMFSEYPGTHCISGLAGGKTKWFVSCPIKNLFWYTKQTKPARDKITVYTNEGMPVDEVVKRKSVVVFSRLLKGKSSYSSGKRKRKRGEYLAGQWEGGMNPAEKTIMYLNLALEKTKDINTNPKDLIDCIECAKVIASKYAEGKVDDDNLDDGFQDWFYDMYGYILEG